MIRYYRHNGGYIAVTDTSPAGFEGLVFVGRGGPIDNITEQLFAATDLVDLVDVGDVPPSWCAALGYHQVQDFPLLDATGDNLVAEIPVRVPVETVPRIVRPRTKFNDIAVYVGMGLGLIIVILYYAMGGQ